MRLKDRRINALQEENEDLAERHGHLLEELRDSKRQKASLRLALNEAREHSRSDQLARQAAEAELDGLKQRYAKLEAMYCEETGREYGVFGW